MMKRIMRARRILVVLAASYAAGMAILSVLWRVWPQRWWVAISTIFAVHLFWPLLVLLPAAIVARSRWLAWLAALPTALAAAMFGARFLPRRQHLPHGQHLRVATYNLSYMNQDAAAILAAIRRQQADIVALQELTPPIAAQLARDLHAAFPYQALLPAAQQHGMGLLSRYPLAAAADQPGFRVQQARVTVGQHPITLLNVHPTTAAITWARLGGMLPMITNYQPGARRDQIAALLATIDALDGPLIVLGDFNLSEREAQYRDLAARLHDTFRAAGWGLGLTFPRSQRTGRFSVPFPMLRIDYIWTRGAIAASAARVIHDNGGSDHCLLVADLVVASPASMAHSG